MTSWLEIEQRRKAAGLSRAEMCRRASVSESTVFKGLRAAGRPSTAIARLLDQVLQQAEQEAAA